MYRFYRTFTLIFCAVLYILCIVFILDLKVYARLCDIIKSWIIHTLCGIEFINQRLESLKGNFSGDKFEKGTLRKT